MQGKLKRGNCIMQPIPADMFALQQRAAMDLAVHGSSEEADRLIAIADQTEADREADVRMQLEGPIPQAAPNPTVIERSPHWLVRNWVAIHRNFHSAETRWGQVKQIGLGIGLSILSASYVVCQLAQKIVGAALLLVGSSITLVALSIYLAIRRESLTHYLTRIGQTRYVEIINQFSSAASDSLKNDWLVQNWIRARTDLQSANSGWKKIQSIGKCALLGVATPFYAIGKLTIDLAAISIVIGAAFTISLVVLPILSVYFSIRGQTLEEGLRDLLTKLITHLNQRKIELQNKILKEGTRFIIDEVLAGESVEIKQSFMGGTLDPSYIFTKAVYIYAVGPKKTKTIPAFFGSTAKKAIEEFRLSHPQANSEWSLTTQAFDEPQLPGISENLRKIANAMIHNSDALLVKKCWSEAGTELNLSQ